MRLRDGIALDFDDVLLIPQRSSLESRANVELVRTFKFPHSSIRLDCIGIVAANMDTTGTFAMAKALAKHKMLTAIHKHYSVDKLVSFFGENHNLWDSVFYTIGTNERDFEKLNEVNRQLFEKYVSNDAIAGDFFPHLLCLDAANGYSEIFVDRLKRFREKFGCVIMAGNVVTANMAEELILSGADIAKVGIGGGSCCLTRVKTGVGFPQLSAVDDCAHKVHGLRGQLCSDGGCRNSADVCKAFAAGADMIMAGNLFAGTDECDGEWVYKTLNPSRELNDVVTDMDLTYETTEKEFLKFHGMASKEAMEQHNGGVADYRPIEGKEVLVPYKGSVENIVKDLLGSLRSCCTYMGAKYLKDLPKCAEFQRVLRTHNTFFG